MSGQVTKRMNPALPPLLRGIGTLVILTTAVIAFCIAHRHERSQRTGSRPNPVATGKKSGDSPASSVSEGQEPGVEIARDTVVEEVLENDWVECLGLVGTAIFGASFFVEASIRQNKST